MFEYLKKFNELPEEIQDLVAGPEAIKIIEILEMDYSVDLAAAVMRVMVGEIPIVDLPKFFVFDFNLDGARAQKLTDELVDKLFSRVADYLGIGIDRGMPVDQVEIPEKDEKLTQVQARGSTFFFSPEDEEEVRTLAQKVEIDKSGDKIKEEIEERLNKILLQAKVNLSSEILADRFINVLRTYLRNVRNKIETRETLIKPTHVGGVGLDEATADRVLGLADNIRNGLHKQKGVKPPPKIPVPEDSEKEVKEEKKDAATAPTSPIFTGDEAEIDRLKQSGVRDVDYDFASIAKDKKEDTKATRPEKLDLEHELAPPPPAFRVEPKAKDIPPVDLKAEGKETHGEKSDLKLEGIIEEPIKVKTKKTEPAKSIPSKPASPPLPIPKSGPMSVRRPAPANGKIIMEDVKHVPKLMGPIEELKNMDLINFRRLNKDPLKAVGNLKEKLDYLEEEDYRKRREGIKAWRESPINNLYLFIGQESINNNQPIEEVMQERATAGKEFLTTSEFDAIMQLNKDIRY